MKARVLAIDDLDTWRDNYRAWIPSDLAEQDSAATTMEAAGLLRRRRYDVVLLDLSMKETSQSDRSNRGIQEYLASAPEGTQYIIVSGVIDGEAREVRNAAIDLKAFDVLFKLDVEETLLRDTVSAAIEVAQRKKPDFIQEARLKLSDSGRLDHELLKALAIGADGLHRLLDSLFRKIGPIVPHSDRPLFAIGDRQVLALVWSRQLGMAISISITNEKLRREEASIGLAKWLGYEQRGDQVFERRIGKNNVVAFAESSISDKHFSLPQIHV